MAEASEGLDLLLKATALRDQTLLDAAIVARCASQLLGLSLPRDNAYLGVGLITTTQDS